MLDQLKKVPAWLYTVLVVGVLGFLVRYYRRASLSAHARAAVDIELAKIETAKLEREKLDQTAIEQAAQVEYYNEAIAASQREVVALHQSVEGLDAKAIADRFEKLGL